MIDLRFYAADMPAMGYPHEVRRALDELGWTLTLVITPTEGDGVWPLDWRVVADRVVRIDAMGRDVQVLRERSDGLTAEIDKTIRLLALRECTTADLKATRARHKETAVKQRREAVLIVQAIDAVLAERVDAVVD